MSGQRVYLCRYGLRATELVPYEGPFDMGLHVDGVLTARELGALLSSESLRSLTTANIAAEAMAKGSPVCVEVGVTEWYDSSLVSKDCYVPPPIDSEPWYSDITMVDRSYKSVMEDGWLPKFEESEEDLLKRADLVLAKLIKVNKDYDLAIVSHAPCLLAFALSMAGEEPSSHTLNPSTLGSVTCFVKEEGKRMFKAEYQNKTSHLSGDAKYGIGGWMLPCLEKNDVNL